MPNTIVFCCDVSWIKYLVVPLSRIEQLHSIPLRVIVIVSENFPSEAQQESEKLMKLFSHTRMNVRFKFIQNAEIERHVDLSHSRLPHATYLRLWITELLPNENFILYLDVDIWIDRPITYLLQLNPKRAIAAHNLYGSINAMRLFGSHDLPYFSAGTLVLNVSKLRKMEFFEKTTQQLRANSSFANLEMDAMNLVLRGLDEVEHINENFCWHSDYPRFKFEYSREGLMYHSIAIVHFNGPEKPWSRSVNNIFHYKWRQEFRRLGNRLDITAIDLLGEKILNSSKVKDRIISRILKALFYHGRDKFIR